jgi:hypothetical protein
MDFSTVESAVKGLLKRTAEAGSAAAKEHEVAAKLNQIMEGGYHGKRSIWRN